MNTFLSQSPPWLGALLLAGCMGGAWGFGRWWGRRTVHTEPDASARRFVDACIALVGLLLGFTFSMALAKHDLRRQMLVTDSNAIGDFYTCVSLVKEPHQSKLQAIVRRYTVHRLAIASENPDPAALDKKLAEIQQIQNEMQALVSDAIVAAPGMTVPLVNTLNGVTSSNAARLAAARDHLPSSILVMLIVSASVSMGLYGRHDCVGGTNQFAALFGFIVLVALVFWVILDLNQGQRGFITVNQEPLERLLRGMGE